MGGDDPRRRGVPFRGPGAGGGAVGLGHGQAQPLGADKNMRLPAVRQAGRREAAHGRMHAAAFDHPGEPVDLAEEGGDEPIRRPEIDFHRGAGLDDPALVHDRDVIGHEHGLFGVVGDHQGGDAGFLEQAEGVLADLEAQVHVQVGEGLVQQQHPGLRRQGAEQGDTLLLAARQGMGVGVGKTGHVGTGQGLARPLQPPGRRVRQAKGDVLEHGQMGKQGVVLEHQADAPFFRRHVAPPIAIGEDALADGDPAVLHDLQPGGDPQQRRLAATRRAQQAGHLSRRGAERGVEDHGAAAVGVGNAGEAEPFHGVAPAPSGAPVWPGRERPIVRLNRTTGRMPEATIVSAARELSARSSSDAYSWTKVARV